MNIATTKPNFYASPRKNYFFNNFHRNHSVRKVNSNKSELQWDYNASELEFAATENIAPAPERATDLLV